MAGLRVEMDPGRLPDLVAARRAAADRVIDTALEKIGRVGERTAKGLAPVRTGRYRRSIGHRVTRDGGAAAVEIGAPRIGHLVEKGRRAGKMPPPAKIAKAFGVPLREAFPIARAIGRGAPGTPVMALTERRIDSQVRSIAEDALRDLGRLEQ